MKSFNNRGPTRFVPKLCPTQAHSRAFQRTKACERRGCSQGRACQAKPGLVAEISGVGRDLPADLSSRLLLLPGFARRSDCTSVAWAPRGSESGRCPSLADYVTG